MRTILLGLFIGLLLIGVALADDPVKGRLNIATEGLATSTFPYQLRVTNGTLTDNGDGTASLSTSSGVNGTSLNITNLTINNTLSTPAGVDLNIASGSGVTNFTGGNVSAIQMYNGTGVLVNCTVNTTNAWNCVP